MIVRQVSPQNRFFSDGSALTYELTNAYSRDSDQPAHPHNLISLGCLHRSLAAHKMPGEESDQVLSLLAYNLFVGFAAFNCLMLYAAAWFKLIRVVT